MRSKVQVRGRIVDLSPISSNCFKLDVLDDSHQKVPRGIPKVSKITYSVLLNLQTLEVLKNNLRKAGIEIDEAEVLVSGILTFNLPVGVQIADVALISETIESIEYNRLVLAQESQHESGLKPIVNEARILWPTDKIDIPEEFLAFSPREEKIVAAANYYEEHGQMEKPIEVLPSTEGRVLLKDGYARYLSNIRNKVFYTWINGVDTASIEVLRKKSTAPLDKTTVFPNPLEPEVKKMVPIEEVIIPMDFKIPREEKIQAAMDFYIENGKMEKPIETRVLPDGKLQMRDGYAKYLAAKQLGHSNVWVIH